MMISFRNIVVIAVVASASAEDTGMGPRGAPQAPNNDVNAHLIRASKGNAATGGSYSRARGLKGRRKNGRGKAGKGDAKSGKGGGGAKSAKGGNGGGGLPGPGGGGLPGWGRQQCVPNTDDQCEEGETCNEYGCCTGKGRDENCGLPWSVGVGGGIFGPGGGGIPAGSCDICEMNPDDIYGRGCGTNGICFPDFPEGSKFCCIYGI